MSQNNKTKGIVMFCLQTDFYKCGFLGLKTMNLKSGRLCANLR